LKSEPSDETVEPVIPADAERYPFGCPDADWCRGNRCCYWDCKADPDADLGEKGSEMIIDGRSWWGRRGTKTTKLSCFSGGRKEGKRRQPSLATVKFGEDEATKNPPERAGERESERD